MTKKIKYVPNITPTLKSHIGKSFCYAINSNENININVQNCHFLKINEGEFGTIFSMVSHEEKLEMLIMNVKVMPLSFIHFEKCGKFKTFILKLLGGK